MIYYILLGVIIGSVIGYIVPLGYFFWFVVGAVTGYWAHSYFGSKF